MICLEIKNATKLIMRPVGELIPYVRNARIHSDEQIVQLRASLREFGFVSPILIDGNDNVIAGHGRLLAAKAEGITEVPCVLVEHLTDVQRKAYILADNRLAEQAKWDDELVRLELEELRAADFDIELTGFDEDIVLYDCNDIETDHDVTLPVEPKTKPGDIYILGKHRLMCGDCNDERSRNLLLGTADIELVYTDPPYDMSMSGGGCFAGSMQNTVDELKGLIEFDPYTLEWLSDFPTGSWYIWTSKNGIPKYLDIFKKSSGFNILTWIKTNPVPFTHDSFLPDTEYCLYFKNKNAVWHNSLKPTEIYRRSYISSKETRTESGDDPHPTIKPLDTVVDKIRISSNKGGAVFDPFGGAGTTLIACEKLERICYMMEIDPRFVDVIVERWEKFTGQKAELIV